MKKSKVKKYIGYTVVVAIAVAIQLTVIHVCSFSSDKESSLNLGDKVVITETSLGTFRKEDCKEFVKMLQERDELSIGLLESSGLAIKVDKGTRGTLTGARMNIFRVKLDNGEELWFPSVAVEKKD